MCTHGVGQGWGHGGPREVPLRMPKSLGVGLWFFWRFPLGGGCPSHFVGILGSRGGQSALVGHRWVPLGVPKWFGGGGVVLGSSGGCPCCWGARSPREGDLGCMGGVPGCGGSRCWSLPERTQPWRCPELGCSEEPWGAPIFRGDATGAGYWGGGAGLGPVGCERGHDRRADTGEATRELNWGTQQMVKGGARTQGGGHGGWNFGVGVEDTRERNAAGGIRGN